MASSPPPCFVIVILKASFIFFFPKGDLWDEIENAGLFSSSGFSISQEAAIFFFPAVSWILMGQPHNFLLYY